MIVVFPILPELCYDRGTHTGHVKYEHPDNYGNVMTAMDSTAGKITIASVVVITGEKAEASCHRCEMKDAPRRALNRRIMRRRKIHEAAGPKEQVRPNTETSSGESELRERKEHSNYWNHRSHASTVAMTCKNGSKQCAEPSNLYIVSIACLVRV